jgi:hypothetical protein
MRIYLNALSAMQFDNSIERAVIMHALTIETFLMKVKKSGNYADQLQLCNLLTCAVLCHDHSIYNPYNALKHTGLPLVHLEFRQEEVNC